MLRRRCYAMMPMLMPIPLAAMLDLRCCYAMIDVSHYASFTVDCRLIADAAMPLI